MGRAQANVVGVALLVGITVVSLGLLTASAGTVIDASTARADAARVADGLDAALRPGETVGARERRFAVGGGTFRTVPRDLRVLDRGRVVAHREVGALRYRNGGTGAAFVAGAILRHGAGGDLVRAPPVRSGGGLLVVNAPVLRGDVDYATSAGQRVTVRTRVTHARTALGPGTYRVAIETASPGVLAAHFRERGHETARADRDGDGVPSVVVAFPNAGRAVLLTHETAVSVDG